MLLLREYFNFHLPFLHYASSYECSLFLDEQMSSHSLVHCNGTAVHPYLKIQKYNTLYVIAAIVKLATRQNDILRVLL